MERTLAGSRWSVPQPEKISAGRPLRASQALPAFTARWISSSEVGQSSPMPRWAVSMASATPSPRSQRYSR